MEENKVSRLRQKVDPEACQPPHQNFDEGEGFAMVEYGAGRACHQAEAKVSNNY